VEHLTNIESKLPAQQKDYLPQLVAQLEQLIEQDVSLPFHFKQIKDKGLIVHVKGLHAFLSFDYMPWRYGKRSSWQAVFKSIKGKQFYGRVNC
jgi:hypothetical protein